MLMPKNFQFRQAGLLLGLLPYFLLTFFIFSAKAAQNYGDSGEILERVPGRWTDFSVWSSCSRPCGGGLQLRTRRCTNSTLPSTSRASSSSQLPAGRSVCSGPFKQFRTCNLHSCPAGTGEDIRREECAKYDSRPFNNRRYKWVPKEGTEDRCELVCKAVGYDFHARLAHRVPDGATCGQVAPTGDAALQQQQQQQQQQQLQQRTGANSVCIRGECRTVGCDGIVDSGLVRDACGLCGGQGRTCQTYSGIYMRTEVVNDLLPVVTIPAGTSHLNVTDLKPTINYYVVQDSVGQVLVDGSRQTEYSQQYEWLGTRITYYRPGGGRSQALFLNGRLPEPLRLLIYSTEENPGVIYQYLRPTDDRPAPTVVPLPSQNLVGVNQGRQGQTQQQAPVVQYSAEGAAAVAGYPQSSQYQLGYDVQSQVQSPTIERGSAETGFGYQQGRATEYYYPVQGGQAPATGTAQRSSQHVARQHQHQQQQQPPHPYQGHRQHQPHQFHQQQQQQQLTPYGQPIAGGYLPQQQQPGAVGGGYLPQQQLGAPGYGPQQPLGALESRPVQYAAYPGQSYQQQPLPPQNYGGGRGGYGAYPQAAGYPAPQPYPAPRARDDLDDLEEYVWRKSGFTECSRSCAGGVQESIILCIQRKTKAQVTDENCDTKKKPQRDVAPCKTQPCDKPEWFVKTNWSDCSSTCGQGRQTRVVECIHRIGPTPKEFVYVSASLCDASKKAPSVQNCRRRGCGVWSLGAWQECSSRCGRGFKARDVRCVDQANRLLPDSECDGPRPRDKDSCIGDSPSCWFFTKWSDYCSSDCGQGVYTRKVQCLSANEMSPGECDSSDRPKEYAPCGTEGAQTCGGKWFTGPWSKCTSSCSGMRHREVICMKQYQNNWVSVTDQYCGEGEKPRAAEKCPESKCEAEWYTTKWSKCSVSCGAGYQTREVRCLDAKSGDVGENCPGDERPDERRVCEEPKCPAKETAVVCEDRFNNCYILAKNPKLCEYAYYKDSCCNTCASAAAYGASHRSAVLVTERPPTTTPSKSSSAEELSNA